MVYSDGDWEDFDGEELLKYLWSSNVPSLQVKSCERYARSKGHQLPGDSPRPSSAPTQLNSTQTSTQYGGIKEENGSTGSGATSSEADDEGEAPVTQLQLNVSACESFRLLLLQVVIMAQCIDAGRCGAEPATTSTQADRQRAAPEFTA